MAEPKEGLALILGGKSEPKESAASDEEDAMSDFLDAMKADDPKGMHLAMKRHYELCAMDGDGGDGEEGMMSEEPSEDSRY